MVMNIGYISAGELYGGTVRARVYYDTTFEPVGPEQPLVNGPGGYCLEVINTSGKSVRVSYTVNDVVNTAVVGQGNPVTTGVARSRTAAQVAAFGATTRGDVTNFTMSESTA